MMHSSGMYEGPLESAKEIPLSTMAESAEHDSQFNCSPPSSQTRDCLVPKHGAVWRRWWILVCVCVANSLNNSLGAGFAAIATASASYFDTSTYGINGLLAVQFATAVVLNFPAQALVDAYGLKSSMYIGIFFNVVGAWVRFVARDGGAGSFPVLMAGTALTAVGSPFLNGLGPTLASRFFLPTERSMVVGLVLLTANVGGGVGLAMGPAFKDNIKSLVVLQTVLQSVQVFFLIGVQSKPPYPPSPLPPKTHNYSARLALTHLRKYPRFVVVACAMGLMNGTVISTISLLQQLTPFAEEFYVSICILLLNVSGVIAVVVFGRYTDKHRNYMVMFGRLSGFALFCICMVSIGIQMNQIGIVVPFMVLAGLGGMPLVPIVTEWCVEITYAPGLELEATIAGVLMEVVSIAVVVLLFLLDPNTTGDYRLSSWLGCIIQSVCISTIVWNMKGDLKRFEREQLGYQAEEAESSKSIPANDV